MEICEGQIDDLDAEAIVGDVLPEIGFNRFAYSARSTDNTSSNVALRVCSIRHRIAYP